MALRPPARPTENDAVGSNVSNEFASVRVGGAVDGHRVTGALAEGGMGAVFRAQTREGNEVALKAPLPGGRGGTYYHRMRRFLREARLTARMDHVGVARVREQGHANGLPYFTLELVDGTPLSERLYNEGILGVREATEIVQRTAHAAHHIHEQGVIHRDLKPANILIRPDGDPVIIDFGLARDAWGIDPRITESGIWLGTPAYIAPEQATGEASRVDARADVYSLGAILYELLTGMPPYGVGRPRTIFKALRERDPRPVSHLRDDVPEALERICMKALSRYKDDRYPNAEAFSNALADFLATYEVDDAGSVADDELEISEDLCSKAEIDVAKGWNNSTHAEEPTEFHDNALELIEPEMVQAAQTARMPRSSSSSSSRRRRPVGTAKRARIRRARQAAELETMGRILAFCGPAAAAIVGLLLLL